MVAALAALPAVGAAEAPRKVGPTTSMVGVLEFNSRLNEEGKKEIDAGYFANKVRIVARKALPGMNIITRDSMATILKQSGKAPEECVGECATETGRLIGADFIVVGEVARVGTRYKLTLTLYETLNGNLLNGQEASGRNADELDASVARLASDLFEPLRPKKKDGGQQPGISVSRAVVLPEVPALQEKQGSVFAGMDVEPDLLVARDTALRADKQGKERPEEAASAWKALAAIPGKNPFLVESAAREKQWTAYAEKKRAFELQLAKDTERLQKVLPLSSIEDAVKTELLVRYAQLYGMEKALGFIPLIESPATKEHAVAAVACEGKDAVKCLEAAEMAEKAKNPTRAAQYFERACDAGSAVACEKLGAVYLGGEGVERDMTRAISMLDRACDARRAFACSRLARVFEEGEGVNADQAHAVQLREKGCNAGDGESCARLAAAYEAGVSVATDAGKAKDLWQRACKMNDPKGCERVNQIEAKERAEQTERDRLAREEKEKQDRIARQEREKREAIQRAEWEKKRKLDEAKSAARRSRRIGYLLVGLGALSGGGAAFFAMNAGGVQDKLRTGAYETGKAQQAAIDDANTSGKVALGFAAGAAVGVAVGALLIFGNPEPSGLRAGIGPGGLFIAGTFP